MQVYFSHSYRDLTINNYFRRYFDDEEIPLRMDQKTDIWCVPKLERSLGDATGFISIIPPRPSDGDPAAYSEYIGQELNLARRARVPRLLFVEERVLGRHRLDFPEDAVPFRSEALEEGKDAHAGAVVSFRQTLETAYRPPRSPGRREAALVVSEGPLLRGVAADVDEHLRRAGFAVTRPLGRSPGRGLDDIRLLELLWRAELCVFLLNRGLTDAHVALAMAHAHCIPSLRLQYDAKAAECSPSLMGEIRWRAESEMLIEFERQLHSFQAGLVSAEADLSSVSTMQWRPRDDNLWSADDGPGLLRHVHPGHRFVQDEVSRVNKEMRRALSLVHGREDSMDVCAAFYAGLQRHRYAYEIEQVTGQAGRQAIRTPTQIAAHNTATCIDVVCLFAAMLEAAGQYPLIVVLDGPGFAHALAGYRVSGEPAWENRGIGDLRGAVARGDAVLFEATGAVQVDPAIGGGTARERHDSLLGFTDAVAAAERMLRRPDVRLRHFVDVRALRQWRP